MANYGNTDNPADPIRSPQQPNPNSSETPILPSNIYKLEKDVISNARANQLYQKDFSKLAKSNEPIDQDKIVQKYDDLFYNIKIDGKESHKSIVEESYNYLHEAFNKQLQNRIDKLLERLAELGKELSDLQNPATNEHPIYEDGSFLIAGVNGEKYADMHTIYIMQEGRKRAIDTWELYTAIRRLFDLPEDTTGIYYVDIDNIQPDKIPDGTRINTLSDLHMKGDELLADYGTILGISAWVEVELTCKGNEIWDNLNLILGDDPDKVAQFYLNNDPCKVVYIKDEYSNDELGPEVIELTLQKGESQTVRLLREIYLEDEEGFGINNLPNNMQTYYDQYSNPDAEVLYNGSTVSNYIKNWGPGTRYSSVVYAEGRIMSEEQWQTALNNEYFTQDRTLKIFNGLPTAGSEGFDIVEMPDDLGVEYFGSVRRIYQPGSGYWGALNQSMDFQKDKFNDRDFGYYRKSDRRNNGFDISSWFPGWVRKFIGSVWVFRSKSLPIYGQPIIRGWNCHFIVAALDSWGITIPSWVPFIGGDRWAFEFYVLFDLDNKDFFTKSKSKGDSISANLRMNISSGHIQSMNWGALNKDQLRYIGMKGEGTVGYGTKGTGNDNPFNPKTGGSNYELNGANRP